MKPPGSSPEDCNFICPENSCIKDKLSCVDYIGDCVCDEVYRMSRDNVCEPVNTASPALQLKCSGRYALDGYRQRCILHDEQSATPSCDGSYVLSWLAGTLACVKESVSNPEVECPDGYEYQRKSGKDRCERIVVQEIDPVYTCKSGDLVAAGQKGASVCVQRKEKDAEMFCPSDYGLTSYNTCLVHEEMDPEADCSGGLKLVKDSRGLLDCVDKVL